MCRRPGGVDDADVGTLVDGLLHGVERDGGWVGVLRAGDDAGADAVAPGLQLVWLAAARKVSAAPSTTLRPSATSTRASLPVVVVLPVPLTPTTRITPGRPSAPSSRRARSRVGSTRASSSSRSRARAPATSETPSTRVRRCSAATSSCVGPDAEVGGEQGLLDLVPGVLVELVAGEQRRAGPCRPRCSSGPGGRAGGPGDRPTGRATSVVGARLGASRARARATSPSASRSGAATLRRRADRPRPRSRGSTSSAAQRAPAPLPRRGREDGEGDQGVAAEVRSRSPRGGHPPIRARRWRRSLALPGRSTAPRDRDIAHDQAAT